MIQQNRTTPFFIHSKLSQEKIAALVIQHTHIDPHTHAALYVIYITTSCVLPEFQNP